MAGHVSGLAARARLGEGKVWEGVRLVVVPEANRKVVLLLLAERAHADGSKAFPSVGTLAGESGLSPRSVQRALQSLVADGFVGQYRRRRDSAEYRLDLGRLRAADVLRGERHG